MFLFLFLFLFRPSSFSSSASASLPLSLQAAPPHTRTTHALKVFGPRRVYSSCVSMCAQVCQSTCVRVGVNVRPRVPINVYVCGHRQETDRGIHLLLCIRACLRLVWLAPGHGRKRGGGSGNRSNRSTKREREEEEEEISNIMEEEGISLQHNQDLYRASYSRG